MKKSNSIYVTDSFLINTCQGIHMSVTITGGITVDGISFILPPSATFGWFGGGYSNQVSTVNRITFATDTSTASTRGPLAFGQQRHAATGNSNYGWYASGESSGSLTRDVNLITYATDTATAVSTGLLSSASFFLAAAGTQYYGWFGGGSLPASSNTARVDRIDYSVTTATATSRGSLSIGRGQLSATSDYNTYGWFAGGSLTPGPSTTENLSTIDRITYANDTATASVRGPLNAVKYGTASAGNTVNGWFAGGTINSTAPASVYTTIERITYANDTVTTSVRGPLVTKRFSAGGAGNIYYGWFAAGYAVPSILSSVNRVDYSNDTVTASVRGGLGRSTLEMGATSNTGTS